MESFVRNRADLGGDLCLGMGSGIIVGIYVGVEGLGSLLGLARKSATDALVDKDKDDMAEAMSRATGCLLIGWVLLLSGLVAARTFRFESFRGRKGRVPPIFSGTCRQYVGDVEEMGFVDISNNGAVPFSIGWTITCHRDYLVYHAIFCFDSNKPLPSSLELQGLS